MLKRVAEVISTLRLWGTGTSGRLSLDVTVDTPKVGPGQNSDVSVTEFQRFQNFRGQGPESRTKDLEKFFLVSPGRTVIGYKHNYVTTIPSRKKKKNFCHKLPPFGSNIQQWLPMSRRTILMQIIDNYFGKMLGSKYLHALGTE